ncbi:MAG: hypothetical protein IPM28_11385 [Chloracidobacterium sp.]|nr:hypothetical protein [Chloracidobacterium sp.]
MELFSQQIPALDLQPELNAVRTGELPTLLLVHGANSTHAVWRGVMTELASKGITSVAVELRGPRQERRQERSAELRDRRLR